MIQPPPKIDELVAVEIPPNIPREEVPVVKETIKKSVKKRLLWRNIIAATFSILIFAPIVYWAQDRTPPYTFTSVEIQPKEVVAGEEIRIIFGVKLNDIDCGPGLIYRTFVDSTGFLRLYDPVPRSEPVKLDHDGKFRRMARISPSFAPGPTKYRGHACYSCNPLQQWLRWPVCTYTPEVTFNVLPKPLIRGEQGIQGERGPTGEQGQPGKDR